MKSKSPVFKVILSITLVCVLIFLVAGTALLFWIQSWGRYSSFGPKVLKDSQLIAIFQTHQEVFLKLQHMASEETRHGWYFNSPNFEGSRLDGLRQQEYKGLVAKISPDLIVNTDYDSTMRFIFAGGGTSAIGSGWAKGIEFVPGSCEVKGAIYGNSEIKGGAFKAQWKGIVCKNLDNVEALQAPVYLRPIESNWFIFYQRTD